MKKFTMIQDCLQSFISKDELKSIALDNEYVDTARKFDLYNLFQYWIATAIDKWKSFRDSEDKASSCSLEKVDYSTFSKKASNVPFEIFKQLFHLVLNKCNRNTLRNLKISKKLLSVEAVDSTTITAGKAKWAWAPFHGNRSGVKLHIQFNTESLLPSEAEETGALVHDNTVKEKTANRHVILVEDRAYGKLKKFDNYKENKQNFVIRIKQNFQYISKKSLQRTTIKGSNVLEDFTCILGTAQKHTQNRHRIIIFKDYKGKNIIVCTDLMDISAEKIAEIYKMRWHVEVFFK